MLGFHLLDAQVLGPRCPIPDTRCPLPSRFIDYKHPSIWYVIVRNFLDVSLSVPTSRKNDPSEQIYHYKGY
jgi:hypothetical protein